MTGAEVAKVLPGSEAARRMASGGSGGGVGSGGGSGGGGGTGEMAGCGVGDRRCERAGGGDAKGAGARR